MRPKLITPRTIILCLVVVLLVSAYFVWQQGGGTLPFLDPVPSTVGKLAFVRDGDIYMVDGSTGSSAVNLTSSGKGTEAEPAWSEKGDTIALTSDRNGVVRQLYIMNAVPGANIAVRTNSSSTKELPQYGPEGDIYFLDAGKISKITPKTADTDAIFPTAEQKRKALAELFASGGISRFAVSPDGSRLFAAVKQERGEALVVFIPEQDTVAAFAMGEKVLFQMGSDGNLIAVVCGGEPFPQPIGLMTPQTLQQMDSPAFIAPKLPPYSPSDTNIVFKVSTEFAVQPITPVPFAPTGIAVTSDGTHAALTSDKKEYAGVFVIPLNGGNEAGPVAALPASEPAFSPDGTKIAFVSGGDIYTVNTTGDAAKTPLNLTKGQGKNSYPVWSPAKPKK